MLAKLLQLTHRDFGLSVVNDHAEYRCMPFSIGYCSEDCPEKYRWNNNKRERFCLFQYTLSGSGCFSAGGQAPLRLEPGTAFLVESPSDTQYWLPESRPWEFLYVLFVGDLAHYHTAQLIKDNGHLYRLPKNSAPIELLSQYYVSVIRGGVPDKYASAAFMYSFLMELYRFGIKPADEAPKEIAAAHQYIQDTYRDCNLRVDLIARRAGISKFHFSRLFKQYYGLPPYQLILELRLRKAIELISSTELPIKQIYHMVGFTDYAYFCNAFKRHFRFTPSSLRRKKLRVSG